jgi:hypothetical protein
MLKINLNQFLAWLFIKIKIVFLLVISLLIYQTALAQNLTSDQDKGIFVAKCHALAVHILVNDEDLKTDRSLKGRLEKWALNTVSVAEKYIGAQATESHLKKELILLAKIGSNEYLKRQATNCTTILGKW